MRTYNNILAFFTFVLFTTLFAYAASMEVFSSTVVDFPLAVGLSALGGILSARWIIGPFPTTLSSCAINYFSRRPIRRHLMIRLVIDYALGQLRVAERVIPLFIACSGAGWLTGALVRGQGQVVGAVCVYSSFYAAVIIIRAMGAINPGLATVGATVVRHLSLAAFAAAVLVVRINGVGVLDLVEPFVVANSDNSLLLGGGVSLVAGLPLLLCARNEEGPGWRGAVISRPFLAFCCSLILLCGCLGWLAFNWSLSWTSDFFVQVQLPCKAVCDAESVQVLEVAGLFFSFAAGILIALALYNIFIDVVWEIMDGWEIVIKVSQLMLGGMSIILSSAMSSVGVGAVFMLVGLVGGAFFLPLKCGIDRRAVAKVASLYTDAIALVVGIASGAMVNLGFSPIVMGLVVLVLSSTTAASRL